VRYAASRRAAGGATNRSWLGALLRWVRESDRGP
jgi:hypothetical protein